MFVNSACRFARVLFRCTLAMFGARRTERLAPEPAHEAVVPAPSAVAKPEELSDLAQIIPSAVVLRRDELSGRSEVAELGTASLDIAGSVMEDVALVDAISPDLQPVDAGREQSQVPANAPYDGAREELAQSVAGELGGRGDEPRKVAAAIAVPRTSTEPELLVPTADIRSSPAESSSIRPAAFTESGAALPTAPADTAGPEPAWSAPMDVALAAALPFGVSEELSPDTIDLTQSGCAEEPDDTHGANEGDKIVSPSDPGEPATREASGGSVIARWPLDAPLDSGGPTVEAFRTDSDTVKVFDEEMESEVVGLTSKGPEPSAPASRVPLDENEADPVEAGIEFAGPPSTEAEDALVDRLGYPIATLETQPEPGRPPTYRPRLERSRTRREPGLPAANAEGKYQDLEANLQLLFGPGDWGIELSALLRQPVGAEEVAVLEGGDETWLGALDDRLLEPLALADGARVLSEGLSIAAVGLPVRWHRSSRDIHIFGEHPSVAGFVSQPRVAIGRENVVVCKNELSGVAIAQIAATGASAPIRIEGPGVPAGWFCWRGIRPARPSAPQDGPAILHALDPLPAVSIELAGGLQLARGRWLEGHPPSIRLLGLLEPGEPVRIDGRTASLEGDGTWAAEGWDRRGSHRIEYGGITATYEVEPGSLVWDWWPAWGETTAVAGALASANGGRYFHVDPFAHLLGAVPGEICSFSAAIDGIYVARPDFTPVWLLARAASMRSSKPSLIGAPLAPSASAAAATSAIIWWERTICSAGRAGARGSAERRLWDQYLAVAKRKRRPPR